MSAVEARLLGRDTELDIISSALANIELRGAAISVHGEPGIGKSALLAAASRLGESRGFTLVAAAGSEAERHLPWAALYELVRPLLGQLDRLPAEHQGALTRAFGLAAQTTRPEGRDVDSDRFFLALATVELLAAAGAATPLLLLADDVQWWDPASQETLAFVARRIATLPAVLLAATRDVGPGPPPTAGWGTALSLPRLPAAPALALLRQHGPELSPEQEQLVLGVAEGHPLALMELPAALTGRKDDQSVGPPAGPHAEVLPLTMRLERAFATRLAELAPDSRQTLLVAAALDGDLVSEVVTAASTLAAVDDAQAALDSVVRVGLITLDHLRVRFRHPLVRSAVLQLATAGERRAVHHGLALSLADHPDRAAWHRAGAAFGPDEEVAAALDRAGEHALQRGAPAAAAGLFERAAALSIEDSGRGHRLLRAAELTFELGRGESAQRLMAAAAQLVLDEQDQARLAGLGVVFTDTPGSPDDIRLIVESAVAVLAIGDQALGAYLLVGAARGCLWTSAPADVRELVANAAGRYLPESDPRMIEIIGFVDPLGRGAEVVAQLAAWAARPAPDPATGTLLGVASFLVGDFDRTLTFVARSRDGLRHQGRTELLAQALSVQAMAGVYVGRFAEAQDAAVTAYELTRETQQLTWKALATFARSHLAALRGQVPLATELTDEVEQAAIGSGNRALLNRLQFARGLNALGAGDQAGAFAELRRMLDPDDLAFQRSQAVCGIDYLAESAGSDAERDQALTLLAEVEALTGHTTARGVRRAVALARAVLAPDDEAELCFREAAHWTAEATPWHQARLDLALGGWLRRQARLAEARRTLRSAWAVFRALDTPAWAARAERELEAVERLSGPTGIARGTLSAQETQVARLAARGLSNREIGDQLHLSTRTVASHLYRVYPKLGIRSRSQLHLALADRQARQ